MYGQCAWSSVEVDRLPMVYRTAIMQVPGAKCKKRVTESMLVLLPLFPFHSLLQSTLVIDVRCIKHRNVRRRPLTLKSCLANVVFAFVASSRRSRAGGSVLEAMTQ